MGDVVNATMKLGTIIQWEYLGFVRGSTPEATDDCTWSSWESIV